MQASIQALEVVLLDDKYRSERIPSIRLKAASLSTTWSHDCTLLLPQRLHRGQPETISSRNYFMVRTAVSCNYFNSSLDVEEALLLVRCLVLSALGAIIWILLCHIWGRLVPGMRKALHVDHLQEWPISVTFEHLPIQNVKVVNITSEEVMMLRLSAACVDSLKDAVQFADNLREPSLAAPSAEAACDNAAKAGGQNAASRVPPSKPRSKNGCVSGRLGCEPGQMFKILNSTGLGLACYTNWTDAAERVDLPSAAQTTDLKFQPQAGMVYLPDLARKVCSQQDCVFRFTASASAAPA